MWCIGMFANVYDCGVDCLLDVDAGCLIVLFIYLRGLSFLICLF